MEDIAEAPEFDEPEPRQLNEDDYDEHPLVDTGLIAEPPHPVNWNLLTADEAGAEWIELDQWVHWLRCTYGLPASVIPPFWYHFKLRRAWNVLHRAAESGHVFTTLTHGNPRTTSRLEGLNSQIRHLLRHHRGMPTAHRRKAVEWFLLLQEIPLEHAHRHATKPAPASPPPEPDDTGAPPLYDTALSTEEGLWMRTGWAGRG
ncbi:hypothetical protein M3672_03565 [Microbacterium enclense]|uniref:hypothetical protein n=1 Tax=Microbacterium enclense TaxID=993073 RepID=UPI00203B2B88|nr:hypothetical protein [Microbacterium enclense]MCM3613513.1 hypothetical protein [Microbacterium enclense]